VTAPDGAVVEATVERSEPRFITVTLDPRHYRHIALGLDWHSDDQGYVTKLYTEPESEPRAMLPYRGADFREAIEASAYWLAANDLAGRDGEWAARTLVEITKGLPVNEG